MSPPVVKLRGCLQVSPLEPAVAITSPLHPCSSETFHFVSDALSHCGMGNQALATELGFESSPNKLLPWSLEGSVISST